MASVADILSDIRQDLSNFYTEETLATEQLKINAFKRQADSLLNLINKQREGLAEFYENDNNLLNLYQLTYKLIIQIKEWATKTKEQYVIGLHKTKGTSRQLVIATPTIDELLDCTTLLQNADGKIKIAINNLQGLKKLSPVSGKAVNGIQDAFAFLNANENNALNLFNFSKRNYGQKFESAVSAAAKGFVLKNKKTNNYLSIYNKYFSSYINLNQDIFTSKGSDIGGIKLDGDIFKRGKYSIEAKAINMDYARKEGFFGATLVDIDTAASVLVIIQSIFNKANIGQIRSKLNKIVFSKNKNVNQLLNNYQKEMDEDIKKLVDDTLMHF